MAKVEQRAEERQYNADTMTDTRTRRRRHYEDDTLEYDVVCHCEGERIHFI